MITPAATWREKGEPDPHGDRYNCKRYDLAMGDLTDDELANGAFLNYDAPLNLHGILAGTHSSPIAWMTAVKDRIRWLSRQLDATQKLLEKHGVCEKCGQLFDHDIVEPFASCGCGTAEWHVFTPHMQRVADACKSPDGKVLVTRDALRVVLNALVNAPHQIRELQATMEPVELFKDNPINILLAEHNQQQ